MNKIISKTIKITTPILPPKNDFIEQEIKKFGIIPLRWAIIDVKENELLISTSGEEV